jgi:ABC-type glycerol-3-phosphate transport system substrate-binding protein
MATHPIPLTRRALLGLLAGGAAWSLAGCRMPANPLQAPPTPVPVHPTHLGLVLSNQLPADQKQAVLTAYQAAVGAVAARGLGIDRQITAIPISSVQMAVDDIATGFVGSAANGEAPAPDLLVFGNPISYIDTLYLLHQLVAGPLLHPVDAEWKRAPAADTQDYLPNTLDTCRIAGKLYGLPICISPLLLLADPRLLQASKLDTPGNWDWSGLLNAGQKLTRAPGQYAFAPETFYSLEVFLWQHGAAVLSADGTHSTLDTSGAIEAATFYGDLFTRYKVVAPPVSNVNGWTQPDHQLSYNKARIAMVYTGGGAPDRPLEYSEPFHDQNKATVMFLGSLLAMTVRAANPAGSFPVMTALAMELQQRSYLPPRRSLLQTGQPVRELSGWLPSDLSQAEQTALTNALGYARASQVSDPAIAAPFYSKLVSPLQQGTAQAGDACKAAADAINAVLQGGAGTPGPASR